MRRLPGTEAGNSQVLQFRLPDAVLGELDRRRLPGESRGTAARRLLSALLTVDSPRERVLEYVRARAGQLIRVPEIAASLPGVGVAEVLLELDRAGVVELRPESGVGLLAPADAALCPKGFDGWPLSYVRAR